MEKKLQQAQERVKGKNGDIKVDYSFKKFGRE